MFYLGGYRWESNLCNVILALTIVQDDGVTTAPVFAHSCNPLVVVFDDGGCTGIVSVTIDCNATANVQNPSSAN